MARSVSDFWKLVGESRLLSPEQCRHYDQRFGQVKGAATAGNAQTLAEWLIAENALSRYQATVLLAGRPGPFAYGPYTVYDRISAGRLSGMFRAVHAQTGHPVLLQFLSPGSLTEWSHIVARAGGASAAPSPDLARWHHLCDLGTYKFLVLEDLRGQSYQEVIASGQLPAKEACRVALRCAAGLAGLHSRGETHGDVQPANLWRTTEGNVKLLCDPALAPGPIHLAAADQDGHLLVRCDYLAPELALPGRSPDALSDLYALGCTLYHLLSGRAPFAGGTAVQKAARHASEAIAPLEQLGIAPPVAQTVAYLMAKDPSVRYQSAAAASEALAVLVDDASRALRPTPSSPTLATYESWVAANQAELSPRAPAAAPAPVAIATGQTVAAPVINVNAAPSPATPRAVPQGVAPQGTAVASATVTTSLAARRAERKPSRKNQLIGLGVGAAVIALCGILWMLFGPSGDSQTASPNPSTKDARDKASSKKTPSSKKGGPRGRNPMNW